MTRLWPYVLFAGWMGCTCGDATRPNPAAESTAVAIVDGTTVSEALVVARLDADGPLDSQASPERRRRAIAELVQLRLLSNEARVRGIEQQPKVQLAIERILANALIESEIASLGPVDEGLVKARFEERRAQFQREERIRLAHVLFPADTESSRRGVLEHAASELQRLGGMSEQARREAMTALAMASSADEETKTNGGDLGLQSKAELSRRWSAEFAVAAFALRRPGALAVLESPAGVHLVRYSGRVAALNQNFEQIRPRLEQQIQNERRESTETHLENSLRATAEIRIAPEDFGAGVAAAQNTPTPEGQ